MYFLTDGINDSLITSKIAANQIKMYASYASTKKYIINLHQISNVLIIFIVYYIIVCSSSLSYHSHIHHHVLHYYDYNSISTNDMLKPTTPVITIDRFTYKYLTKISAIYVVMCHSIAVYNNG